MAGFVSKRWLRFQAKVLLPIFLILAALAGFIFWLVNDHFNKELQREARSAVETADAAFAFYQQARTKDLQARYVNLSTDTRLRQVLQRNDAKTLEFLLKELIGDFDADAAIFTSGIDGGTLGVERKGGIVWVDLQNAFAPSVVRAMQGDFNIATVAAAGKLWEIVSLPIAVSDNNGVLTFAHAMNEAIANDIKQLTRSEILFITDGKTVVSTIESGHQDTVLADSFQRLSAQNTAASPIEHLQIRGRPFVALAGSLATLNNANNIGYLLLYSSERAWQDLQINQRRLAIASVAGIFCSCALVWLLIRHVTRPLNELRSGAEAVGRGDFSHRVSVLSRDEFGQLAETFNQMTENLKASRAELEQTVDRLKTTQNQLVQTEKLASVGEFVAGITHELNNPLTAVVGFAELLNSSDLSEENREYAQQIIDGSTRCHHIVRSLLSFARKHKPERKMSSINDLVENTLNFVSYEFRTSNIKLTRNLARELPCISADPNQLQQVFLNIVTNARQAMEGFRSDARLHAATERAGDKICVSFADNGPGISAENVAKIFDPFFTTKEVGKGTGLGLSLSYGIIQEHGGTIRVESKTGEGAAFIIELPVTVITGGDSALEECADTQFTRNANEGFGKRILVIDDEDAVGRLVRGALTRRGYKVDTVSDGETGLSLIGQTKYDLIVCDWKMPGLSGQQVFECLQAKHPEIANRIIFMTGDVINERTQQFFRDTGATCIAKPFSIAEFGAAVKKMVWS